jgi:hypothetical protein
MTGLFDLKNGITAGVLRLGIAQGEYTAYIEAADSGVGFKYFVSREDVRIIEGESPDFSSARKRAEEELQLLCRSQS